MKPIGSNRSFSILSALIIFISSALLAVWSLRNTIALRNALLAIGTLTALFLLWQYSKRCKAQASHTQNLSLGRYTPIALTFVMLIWGALIATLVALSLALPWCMGLVVTGPLLGHASWHAYRGAVQWPDDSATG